MNYEKYLKKGEKVIYTAKASFAPAIISGVVFVIFVVLGIILFASAVRPDAPAVVLGAISSVIAFCELLYFIQQLELALTTYILITEERIIMHYGLLRSVFSEIPLDKVSGITINESLSGKICQYGHVIIESSAAISGVKVKYIKHPFEIKKNLPEN